MKKIKDIMDLTVIEIDGASELGKIKEVLIDPDEGKVKYLLIMDEEWYFGAKIISFGQILSIGEDALTIQTGEELQEFAKVKDAIAMTKKNIRILGSKVFTESGQYIGVISEYYINLGDGLISKCILESKGNIYEIAQPEIISFGTRTVIIKDHGKYGKAEALQEYTQVHKTPQLVDLDLGKDFDGNIEKKQTNKDIGGTKIIDRGWNNKKIFEQKHRQFLIGRRAISTIMDGEGHILIKEGEVLTQEILDRVNDNNKIVELTINTR